MGKKVMNSEELVDYYAKYIETLIKNYNLSIIEKNLLGFMVSDKIRSISKEKYVFTLSIKEAKEQLKMTVETSYIELKKMKQEQK